MARKTLTVLFREQFPDRYKIVNAESMKAFADFAEAQRGLDRAMDRAIIARQHIQICNIRRILLDMPTDAPVHGDVHDERNYPPGDVPFEPEKK